MPIEANIGFEFLRKHNCIINTKKSIIKIQEFICEYSNHNVQPEEKIKREIHEKNINIKETNDIGTMIESFKQQNPITGLIPNFKHGIELKENKIIQLKEYNVPLKLRESVIKEINRLLDEKIIRKSNSQYSSPGFPIPKKDGSVRIVVDYRALNRITKPIPYPFPDLRYQLYLLNGCKYFSQIDLVSGYHQIEMKKEDIAKTAFVILGDQYEYLRMPFGLSNAPRTFQCAMKRLFGGFSFVKVFLDDLLIHSKTLEDHKNHLKIIFEILQSNNIKINFNKSNFVCEEVTYLGNIINAEGIRADTQRLKKLKAEDFKPRSLKDVQRILGLLNWYRPYVINLSTKINALTNKLKKEVWKQWSENDNKILAEIISDINQSIILKHPDPLNTFYLYTDASQNGISGVLKQSKGIVGIFSKKLTQSELNYSIVEKECYAIVQSVMYFKTLIYNAKIIIYTDNRNLTFNKEFTSSRWQRWKMILEEYQYELKHIQGKENLIADYFSRNLNIKEETTSKVTNLAFNIIKMQENYQNNSEILLFNLLQKGIMINLKEYKIFVDKNTKMFLFNKYSTEILTMIHEELAHPGISKFFKTIHEEITADNLKK